MEFWLGILIEIVFYFSIVSIYFFPQMKKTFWKKLAVDSVQRNWLPSWDHPELVNQHYWTFCLVTSKSIVFVLCTHITKGQLSPQKFSIYDAINQTLKQNIYNFRSTLESIQENSEEEEKKHYDSVVGTCISCCVWIIYLLPWQAKTTIHTRFHRLFFLFISVKTKDLARSFKTFLFFFLLKTKYGFSTYALWTTAEEKKNNNVTLFFQASERSANRTIYERSLQIKIIPRFCIYELRFQHFSGFFVVQFFHFNWYETHIRRVWMTRNNPEFEIESSAFQLLNVPATLKWQKWKCEKETTKATTTTTTTET